MARLNHGLSANTDPRGIGIVTQLVQLPATPSLPAKPLQSTRISGIVGQASFISVCLSGCVQRAALRTPPPFGRTLSLQTFAPRLSGMNSSPRQARVSLHESDPVVSGWVASAHPPGKHVPHPANKPQQTELNTMFNKVSVATNESWKN
jgi:hypothetical protein